MHIHSSHPNFTREQPHARNVSRRSHGFYHHRNDREQPHARNGVEAKSRVLPPPQLTGNSPHARNVSRRSHGLLPPPQRQGTATCTECVEAKSRSFTTTATTGNSHMHRMCRGEVTVFYHHRKDREQPHAQNVSRRSHGLLPQPQRQGTATCTECVEAKSRVLPPQQQGTATCTKVSRRSTSLLTRCDCHGGDSNPRPPGSDRNPGALPLSYHDLMSVRANFWSYIFKGQFYCVQVKILLTLKLLYLWWRNRLVKSFWAPKY